MAKTIEHDRRKQNKNIIFSLKSHIEFSADKTLCTDKDSLTA